MFKELPEGATHYYNDGCGEPAHNKPKHDGSDEEGVDMEEAEKLHYIGAVVATVLVTLASWGISVLYWFTYNL